MKQFIHEVDFQSLGNVKSNWYVLLITDDKGNLRVNITESFNEECSVPTLCSSSLNW